MRVTFPDGTVIWHRQAIDTFIDALRKIGLERNPMITGIVLMLIGEALMFASWAIGIWTVVFLIINMIYFVLSEEPGLRKRFGKEYEEYCRNVPRYIPRLTPWKPKDSLPVM
jgi:hypothetical protein